MKLIHVMGRHGFDAINLQVQILLWRTIMISCLHAPRRARVAAIGVAGALWLASALGAAACPQPAYPAPAFAYAGADLFGGLRFTTVASGAGSLSACTIPGTRGYANDVATLSLNLSMMDGYELMLDVQSECDSTLLVNAADGSWVFDDDGGDGLMPRIAIADAWRLNGRVDIWIGTYGGGTCPATLDVQTRVAPGMPDEAGDVPLGVAGCPNPSLNGPILSFGGAQLWSRLSFAVQASGSTALGDCGIGGTRGYANPAPSYTLYLSGMQGYRLELSADAACDATMLVRTPDGQWHFNDDGNGNLDPLIVLGPPTALEGRVDVWVGTYGPSPCAATLNLGTAAAAGSSITPPQPQFGAPTPSASPLEGAWSLTSAGRGGTVQFSLTAQGWSGVLNLGRQETLQNVQFDPATGQVAFLRPDPNFPQHYVGTLSGGEIAGTFSQAGGPYSYAWLARR